MAAIESTGEWAAEIKEQNEKHKKLVGRIFFLPPQKEKIKAVKDDEAHKKEMMKKDEKRNRRKREKNLGGEKRKKWKQKLKY